MLEGLSLPIPGDPVTIERKGRIVAHSRNLRGIRDYSRTRGTYLTKIRTRPYTDGSTCGLLEVWWADGAYSQCGFRSYSILQDWVRERRSWRGVEWQDG